MRVRTGYFCASFGSFGLLPVGPLELGLGGVVPILSAPDGPEGPAVPLGGVVGVFTDDDDEVEAGGVGVVEDDEDGGVADDEDDDGGVTRGSSFWAHAPKLNIAREMTTAYFIGFLLWNLRNSRPDIPPGGIVITCLLGLWLVLVLSFARVFFFHVGFIGSRARSAFSLRPGCAGILGRT